MASIRDTQNYVLALDHGISLFDLPLQRVRNELERWRVLLQWLEGALSLSTASTALLVQKSSLPIAFSKRLFRIAEMSLSHWRERGQKQVQPSWTPL